MNMVDNDSLGSQTNDGALLNDAMGIPARSGTAYTGDSIQGVPVISLLDINDLEPGVKHRFLFQGAQMGSGQHWYVPVVVAKGAQGGKRILLTAGVHGDELSPVDAVQRIMAGLDPAKISGSVIAIYGL